MPHGMYCWTGHLGCPDGAPLDPLLARGDDDPVDVEGRRVDMVGIELAGRHQLLHFGDRDAAGGRGHRVEVARGLAVDEVAQPIALPGRDQSEIADNALLEHVLPAVEATR